MYFLVWVVIPTLLCLILRNVKGMQQLDFEYKIRFDGLGASTTVYLHLGLGLRKVRYGAVRRVFQKPFKVYSFLYVRSVETFK